MPPRTVYRPRWRRWDETPFARPPAKLDRPTPDDAARWSTDAPHRAAAQKHAAIVTPASHVTAAQRTADETKQPRPPRKGPLDMLFRPLRKRMDQRGDRRRHRQSPLRPVVEPPLSTTRPAGDGDSIALESEIESAVPTDPDSAAPPTQPVTSKGIAPSTGGWRARRPKIETDAPALRPPQELQADPYAMQSIQKINPLETDVKRDGLPLPEDVPLPEATYEARSWQEQNVAWKASSLKHLPLYFEDVPLERYGHSLGCVQPVWSSGQFLTQLLLIPYQMEIDPPLESVYALGYARPGDPVPRLWYQFPFSPRGTLSEFTFWASNVASLP
jgi:hypothetical protein